MRGGKGRRIDGTGGREIMCVCATQERGRRSGCSRRYSDGGGGERRMGSRRKGGREGEGGEKKGVKNVGAEETGGKNRAVSTEAAGVCREGREGGRWNGAGGRGLKERSRW